MVLISLVAPAIEILRDDQGNNSSTWFMTSLHDAIYASVNIHFRLILKPIVVSYLDADSSGSSLGLLRLSRFEERCAF
jgi:hypothetical protein